MGPSPVEFLWSATGGPSGMDFPGDMAIDPKGRLWVADTGNSRFAIFEPDGTFVEYWEHRGSGVGEFNLERSNGDGFGAIAFAPDGSFYVLDVGNYRVEHFDQQRKYLNAWGGFGSTPGKFSQPSGLAVDAQGVVYVLDDARGVIEWYDAEGNVLGSVDDNPSSPPGSNTVNSFSLDEQGNFYVSDCCSAGNQVQKLDPTGALLVTFGAKGIGPGQFSDQPEGAAVDAAGRLFVGQGGTYPVPVSRDPAADLVQIFDADGSFLASFGPPGLWSGPSDPTGDGQVEFPFSIVLDGLGNVYVADAWGNRIDKFRLLPPFAPAGTPSPSP
jgi:DNA-binding beta-propeller fold protein YncE